MFRSSGFSIALAATFLAGCSVLVPLDGRFCDEGRTCDAGVRLDGRTGDVAEVGNARACERAGCLGRDCQSAIKVEYASTDVDGATTRIRLQLRIVNDSDTDEALEDLEIRYYYSADSGDEQLFECTFASTSAPPGGCDFVTGTIRRRMPAGPGADHELAVGFAAGGTLRAFGGDTAAIKLNVSSARGAQYDQSDDASFDGRTEAPHVWPCVTLHRKSTGSLLFGVPPP